MYGFGPVTGAAAGTAAAYGAATHTMGGYGYGAAPMGACGYGAPVAPVAHGFGAGRGFALIVVLFILLVIIGASWATPTV